MITVPDTLEEWTLDAITRVVDAGIFESRAFDFKETLPNKSDETGRTRLRKTLAAFANSVGGGFLVIGVKDERTLGATDRIVGVPATLDVPEHLKGHDSGCVPRVQWAFRNPPHRLPSGRLVHVVQIMEGRTKPHGLFDGERWVFPKRTDGGNDLMSYEEIRAAFRGQAATRRTLLVVSAEAERMRKLAEELASAVWHRFHEFQLRFLFRPALLDAALAAIVELEDAEGLLYQLNELRSAAAAADLEAERLLANPEETTETIGNLAQHVESHAKQVKSIVAQLLAST